MADAKLNLDVDSSGVTRGSAALDQFQQSAHGAGAETKRAQDSISGLTREMQTMIAQQREVVELMRQVAVSTHATNAELSQHSSRMHSLAVGVTAASTAYLALSEHSRAAGENLRNAVTDQHVSNVNRMTSSLEALNNQLRVTSQWRQVTFGQAAASLAIPGGLPAIGAELTGYNPAFQQINDQIARLTTALSLRTNVDTGTLLQTISSAGRAGMGGDQGVQLAARVSQILHGYSTQDEAARRTLQSYGVNTAGDPNTVLVQALQALAARPNSPFRNAAASQIFGPNFDPALLLQSNIERLTPQGAEGQYELQQQGLAQRIQGQINTLMEQQKRITNSPNRTFFGSDINPRGFSPENPLSFIPGSQYLYRYGQDFGQYFDPNSVFGRTQQALSQERRLNWLKFSDQPFSGSSLSSYLGGAFHTGVAQLKNYANPLLGNVFGTQEIPGVPQQPAAQNPNTPIPQDLLQRFYEVLISAGRTTPEALQSRITLARQSGEDLVKQITGLNPQEGKHAAKQFDEAMTILTRRMERLADPIGFLVNRMTEENQVLAAPQNEQAMARFLETQNQMYEERYGRSLPRHQRSLLAGAFQVRGNLEARNEGQRTEELIQYQQDLAAAYGRGGTAIQEVIARQREYENALKSGADAAHQAANAQKDVALAEATALTEMQKALALGGFQTQAAQRVAAAAGGGPVAVHQAEIQNEALQDFYSHYNRMPQTPAEHELVTQRATQLQTQLRSRATQAIGTTTYQYHQQMGTLNAVLGGGATVPGVTAMQGGGGGGGGGFQGVNPAALAGEWWGATGANPNLRQYLETASQLDPQTANWCAAFANAVLATSGHVQLSGAGKNIATNFANYGSPETGAQAHAGDLMVFMRGHSPGQTGGHVGFFTGETRDGRYGMVSGNHSNRVGYSWVNPADVTFRGVGAGAPAEGGIGAFPAAAGTGGAIGTSPIQAAQARAQATAYFQGLGVNPTGQQLSERTTQILNENFAKLATSTAEQLQAQKQLQQLEGQRAAAEAQGPQAVQALNDQIKIVTETQKLLNTATGDTTGQFEKLRSAVTANVEAQRQAANQAAFAQITRQQAIGIQNTQRQTAAFENGGENAMQLEAAAQPIAQQYITAGMNPDQARQLAASFALAAKSAQDMKNALASASQEISTTAKSAIGDIVGGLTDGIGKAHGLRYAMMGVGLQISKLGLNMFVTKPLDVLMDNITSGRGANFNVGNSGQSYTSLLGKAFMGGLGKVFGFGSSDSGGGSGGSGGNSGGVGGTTSGAGLSGGGGGGSGGFLSSLIGGGSSLLGKALGLGSGGGSGGGSGYGNGDFGGGGSGFGGGSIDTISSTIGDIASSIMQFHSGGTVGAYGYGQPRLVSPLVFAGAPRFHGGGLASDEVPIIAQRGERVLTADQNAAYTAAQSGTAGGDVHVTNNIYTHDAHSFRASGDQVAIDTMNSYQRAKRNT
ncbi:MAG: hypothetical protein KGL39_03315 [Patescibacteria group bacterium]|nr:hypothetical protein [Patescibacteria group bacterium]